MVGSVGLGVRGEMSGGEYPTLIFLMFSVATCYSCCGLFTANVQVKISRLHCVQYSMECVN